MQKFLELTALMDGNEVKMLVPIDAIFYETYDKKCTHVRRYGDWFTVKEDFATVRKLLAQLNSEYARHSLRYQYSEDLVDNFVRIYCDVCWRREDCRPELVGITNDRLLSEQCPGNNNTDCESA